MFNRSNRFDNMVMNAVPAMYWFSNGLTLSYPYHSR